MRAAPDSRSSHRRAPQGASGRPRPPSCPQPRIDHDVKHVGQKVECDIGGRGDQHDTLNNGVVAIEYRIDDQLAEAWNVKICSVSTAPDNNVPNSSAPSVITGVNALRIACLRMTERSSSP